MGDLREYVGIENASEALWLHHPHVHMKDSDKVVEKINHIIKGGAKKLQLIFDFDRTITKYHVDGAITKSSFGVLESLPTVPEDFSVKMKNAEDKLMVVTTDPTATEADKQVYMEEWVEAGMGQLKGTKWDSAKVNRFLKNNQQPFRDGTKDVLRLLSSANVPVLMFSAGIGDVVKAFLVNQGLLSSNVNIASNFVKVEEGVVTGYKNDVIHVFNKNSNFIRNEPYYKDMTKRSNVIILGDSSGDATMANGLPYDNVLKIGFLNCRVEECLPQFKELFDIVLVDDQSMDVLKSILKPTLR